MYLYRLAHALGDEGHDVDVVHCVDSYHLLHPGPPPIAFEEHPRVHRHELRSRFGWVSPLLTHQTGHPFLKRRVIRGLLERHAYDVIHFHNTSLLGPGVLALGPKRDAVTLYTTHEHWLICPNHVLWKFGHRACDGPQCLSCVLRARRPPQAWRYTGQLARMSRHIDRFVSPSRFTADMHARRGFVRPVGHLPYFIDRADEDWQHPGPRPQERPYFLFVGRLEAIKGAQTLVDLWGRVSPSCDLLIVGSGTYEQALKAQAAGNPSIRFLGGRPAKELGTLYHHAVACVVPSLTFETFGIIIIEAFARKTPVVVRDLGALPEVVEESGGGLRYRTDDELLDAISRLKTEPGLRAELGGRGYDAFVRLWSRDAHLRLYFDLIRDASLAKLGRLPWDTDSRR